MKPEGGAYEAVVVGGGLNGLAAAYHLTRLGVKKLALIEQFRLGHDRGSSHGMSRITRSVYHDPDYVRLMQHVHTEEWPRLERDSGAKLLHPNPGCFFGPPGRTIDSYAASVQKAGAQVEWVAPAEARRVFPQFRFENCEGVLLDRTAGIIAAAETIAALIKLCRESGADIFEETPVTSIDPLKDPIEIQTARGRIFTERRRSW